jgi:hypothetical protein
MNDAGCVNSANSLFVASNQCLTVTRGLEVIIMFIYMVLKNRARSAKNRTINNYNYN